MDFTTEELEEMKRLLDIRYQQCTDRVIDTEIDGKQFRIDYYAVQQVVLSALRKIRKELLSRSYTPPNNQNVADRL